MTLRSNTCTPRSRDECGRGGSCIFLRRPVLDVRTVLLTSIALRLSICELLKTPSGRGSCLT